MCKPCNSSEVAKQQHLGSRDWLLWMATCPCGPVQVVQEMADLTYQRESRWPDRLLLVGGFGSSLYLQACLKQAFGEPCDCGVVGRPEFALPPQP
jgi:hypothetical protein